MKLEKGRNIKFIMLSAACYQTIYHRTSLLPLNMPIEFVYLCTSNNSTLEKWKSKIAELEIPGTHIFVDETIETDLMNLFSFVGFPSYALVDTKGNYKPGAIIRPSLTDKLRLIEVINQKDR